MFQVDQQIKAKHDSQFGMYEKGTKARIIKVNYAPGLKIKRVESLVVRIDGIRNMTVIPDNWEVIDSKES